MIPRQFVCLEYTKSRISNILKKEDDVQSSYVVEFFNYKKEFSFNKNYKEFKKICDILKEVLGFDFRHIPERFGNFLFQFPNTIMDVSNSLSEDNKYVNLSVKWDERLEKIPNCAIKVLSEHDDIVLGYSEKYSENFNSDYFSINNLSKKGIGSLIYNLNNNLILYYYCGGYLLDLVIDASV